MSDWKTVKVDYTLAFVQAKMKPGKLYTEKSCDIELDGKILESKQNLYGQRDAPNNFFNYLKKRLQG